MRVLLHIGSPKAGSTTIQHALRLNRERLDARDVLTWEADDSKGDAARTLSNRFAPVVRPLLPRERLYFTTRAETIEWSTENWRTMSEVVQARKPALTVLSSESLFEVVKVRRVLDALRETFSDIMVIAYIRDPAEQYRSAIDQIIRDGARFRDLPMPTEFHFPSHEVIRAYHDALGKERVIVRNFDRRNLLGGDLVGDFFARMAHAAGVDLPAPEAPPQANESLCAAATICLLAMNETFQRFNDGDDRKLLSRRIAMVRRLVRSERLAAYPKLVLGDAPVADWARHAAAPAIDYYNTVFFPDQVPLEEARDIKLPPYKKMRRAVHKWLLDQADLDNLPAVLQEIIR